jgi:hypothetical protein
MNEVLLVNIIGDGHSVVGLMKVQGMLFGFKLNESVFGRLIRYFVSHQFNSLNSVSEILNQRAQSGLIHPRFQISDPESF